MNGHSKLSFPNKSKLGWPRTVRILERESPIKTLYKMSVHKSWNVDGLRCLSFLFGFRPVSYWFYAFTISISYTTGILETFWWYIRSLRSFGGCICLNTCTSSFWNLPGHESTDRYFDMYWSFLSDSVSTFICLENFMCSMVVMGVLHYPVVLYGYCSFC